MDYLAILTPAEAQSLADPDKTFGDAITTLEQLRPRGEWAFQTNIRIKNTLDACDADATAPHRWSLLALLLNCEYALLRLGPPSLPIRHNPFLSHWVESFQRLDALQDEATHEDDHVPAGETGLAARTVAAARAEWIKDILLSGETGVQELAALTPRIFYDSTTRSAWGKPFKIQPYLRMLVEEGIYDALLMPAPEPETTVHAAQRIEPAQPLANANANANVTKKLESIQQHAQDDWKTVILQMLAKQPDIAIQALTHLPLQLLHLDFLTQLLGDHTLEAHAIDPAPIITSYIQHSLRTIERMGEPPPIREEEDGFAGADSDAHHPMAETNGIWEYGQEAQSRSVKLLLLFIKSLLRKSLLGAEGLYFEIQEICVRYVWMKEVRDFRAWVQGEGEM